MYYTVESTEPVLFSLPIQHCLSYRKYKVQNTVKYTWLLKTISLLTWCFNCFPYIVLCNSACSTKTWVLYIRYSGDATPYCLPVQFLNTPCRPTFFSPSKSCTPDLLKCLKVIGWGMETDLTSPVWAFKCDMCKSQVSKYKGRRGED